MAGCRAYASTAGFESICEAMYLGKPVLMVPAHIEQDCNAYECPAAGAGLLENLSFGVVASFCRNVCSQPGIYSLGS